MPARHCLQSSHSCNCPGHMQQLDGRVGQSPESANHSIRNDQEKFAHDHKSRRVRAALHATSHGQHYMARLGCKRQLKARVIHRNTFAEPSGLSTTGLQGVISSRNRVLGFGFRGRCRLPSRCHLEHVHVLRDSWVLKSYIMLLSSSSASRSFDPKSVPYLYIRNKSRQQEGGEP